MPKDTTEETGKQQEISTASAIGGLLVMLVWLVMAIAWFAGLIRSMMPKQWGL